MSPTLPYIMYRNPRLVGVIRRILARVHLGFQKTKLVRWSPYLHCTNMATSKVIVGIHTLPLQQLLLYINSRSLNEVKMCPYSTDGHRHMSSTNLLDKYGSSSSLRLRHLSLLRYLSFATGGRDLKYSLIFHDIHTTMLLQYCACVLPYPQWVCTSASV